MNQLQQLIARFTWRQRIIIVTVAVAAIGGLLWVQKWNTERGFKPLFTGLATEDAGAVTAQLREKQVEYRLTNDGTTILVPEDRVADVRLQLAASGLPQSGRIGFELFDQTNFGASEFAEQVNYHRAIEGELERSVMSIREVERARVHVTMPKESLYKEQRQPAKASVLVKLRPGAELTSANVAAITHLAAAAVPGLKANQVTVLDTSGNLLSRPRAAGIDDDNGASEAALEYRKSLEREIENKIAATLEPLLGADRFRISASADLDLNSGEQSEEIFDPEKSVMVSSQTASDTPAAYSTGGGTPGTPSNLPRATGETASATGASAYGRRTENVAYQTSRVVRHTKMSQGAVKRLSLSVLVDHHLRYDNGKPIVEAPPPEQMQVIKDLVTAAVGLSTERGDQLVVEAFPFESTRSAQALTLETKPATKSAPVASIQMPKWLLDLVGGKQWIVAASGAGVALLVVAIGFFLWKRKRKKKKLAMQMAQQHELAASTASEEAQKQMEARLAEQAAEQSRKEAEAILSIKIPTVSTKKTEVLTKHLAGEAKKDPQAMAHVVRSWLNGEYQR